MEVTHDARRKKKGAGGFLLRAAAVVALMVLAAVVLGYLIKRSRGGGASDSRRATFAARRGTLEITVTEAGTLRTKDPIKITSEMSGSATIAELVEEGTLVKEGDVLIVLDKTQLEEREASQAIELENAQAQRVRSREDKRIQEINNTTSIAKAILALVSARMESVKYGTVAATDEGFLDEEIYALEGVAVDDDIYAHEKAAAEREAADEIKAQEAAEAAAAAREAAEELKAKEAAEAAAAEKAAAEKSASEENNGDDEKEKADADENTASDESAAEKSEGDGATEGDGEGEKADADGTAASDETASKEDADENAAEENDGDDEKGKADADGTASKEDADESAAEENDGDDEKDKADADGNTASDESASEKSEGEGDADGTASEKSEDDDTSRFAPIKGEAYQEFRDAELAIRRAETELENARRDFDGMDGLVAKGFKTRNDFLGAELKVLESERKLESSQLKHYILRTYTHPKKRAQLDADIATARGELKESQLSARSRMRQKEAAIEQAQRSYELKKKRLDETRDQLSKMIIKAPEAGIVIYGDERRWWDKDRIKVGGKVYRGMVLITLPRVTKMLAAIEIPEKDINKFKVDQRAVVTLQALPDIELTGKVAKIASVATQQSRHHSSDVKTFEVEVAFDKQDSRMKPGMSCKTRVLIETITDAIYVPVNAVFDMDDEDVCYIVVGGRTEMIPVKKGKSNDIYIEIIEGLTEGQEVMLYSVEPSETIGRKKEKAEDEAEGDADSGDKDAEKETDAEADGEKSDAEEADTDGDAAEEGDAEGDAEDADDDGDAAEEGEDEGDAEDADDDEDAAAEGDAEGDAEDADGDGDAAEEGEDEGDAEETDDDGDAAAESTDDRKE